MSNLPIGWDKIVAKAQARIDGAKVDALNTRDEKKALELHRAAWAAADALRDFIEAVEADFQEHK